MNQRIKELHDQAFSETSYYGETMQRFAELIVLECMDICEHKGDEGLDGHYCADEIKKHFGVEL